MNLNEKEVEKKNAEKDAMNATKKANEFTLGKKIDITYTSLVPNRHNNFLAIVISENKSLQEVLIENGLAFLYFEERCCYCCLHG
jgi:endonuclease YncB( thermonuclease family)